MTDDQDFLSRWSKRKTAVREGKPVEPEPAPAKPMPAAGREASAVGIVPESSGTQAPVALPPIDSLTIDSDFTPFLQPGVDPALKQEALRKLVRDPRFNVMDGLDVYIDDYSKPDPLPEGWLEKLNQMKRLGHYLEPKEGDAQPLQKPIEEQPVEPDSSASAAKDPQPRSQDSE